MTTDLLAFGDEVTDGDPPFLEHRLKPLAADALPVTFKLTDVVLNLRCNLVVELIVELHEHLTKLAYHVGIDLNDRHSTGLLSFLMSAPCDARRMHTPARK